MKHAWKLGVLTAALMLTGAGCTMSDYFFFFGSEESKEVTAVLKEEAAEPIEGSFEIDGFTFELPEGWMVVEQNEYETMIQVPDPQWDVIVPLAFMEELNGPYGQEVGETADGFLVTQEACAPGLGCWYVSTPDQLYLAAFYPPQSNEPKPDELSEFWATAEVTTDQLLDLVMSIKVTEDDAPTHGPSSLGDAILLLDEPEHALSGRELLDGLYVIHTKELDESTQQAFIDRGWLVNLYTGQVEEFFAENSQTPYGYVVSYDEWGGKTFGMTWQAGWEGSTQNVTHTFEKETGELVATVRVDNGLLAYVSNGETEIEVRLAPENGCEEKADEEEVLIEGLLINDETYTFDTEYISTCQFIDIVGQSFYKPFRALYNSTNNEFMMQLPTNTDDLAEWVTIPFDTLDPNNMEIK